MLADAIAGLRLDRRDDHGDVAAGELRRAAAALTDHVMAVLAGRMGRPVELPVGLLHTTRAERVGAAAFVQVQLAHQAEIAQDLQRAVNSDQPQARLMDAAQCQQLCRGGLAAGLAQAGLPGFVVDLFE